MQRIKIEKWLKGIITAKTKACLGIFVNEHIIHVAEVEKLQEQYTLKFLTKISMESFEEINSDMLAEHISVLCQQNNIRTVNTCLCLPKDRNWTFEKEVPGLSEHELDNALKYQIDFKGPYENDTYWLSHVYLENRLLIAGSISEKEGEELIRHFAQNDLRLCGLTVPIGIQEHKMIENVISLSGDDIIFADNVSGDDLSQGDITAVYAAMVVLNSSSKMNILPAKYQLDDIQWKKLSLTIGSLAIMGMLCVLGGNWWQIHQTEKEKIVLQQSMLLGEKQIEQMQVLQRKYEVVRQKEEILNALSKNRDSMYALMIQLGTLQHEDLALTEVSYAGHGIFVCQGKALTYNAVIDYLDLIADRHSYFIGGGKLLESKLSEDGMILFKIQILVKGN